LEYFQAKSTSCKEAIEKWENETGKKASVEKEVLLSFQWPPIEKMDHHLSFLKNVEMLSLSTNIIEKISNLDSLKNLKVLSLSRNNIKTLSGLDSIGDHLEELWISYNFIEKLKGVHVLRALKVLYMGNNLVKDWNEFNRLQDLSNLEELVFANNPINENLEVESWRSQVIRKLPQLKKLDAIPIM
ncbi:GSCOCG00003702001-RA-CDS, partial [Cotesia congregata]